MNKIIREFEIIRDIPYSIPLSLTEKDECCSGKHKMLKSILEKEGFIARYRICSFLWSSMTLPEKVVSIPHMNESSHLYLEVLMDDNWITVDATWDSSIYKNFVISTWDGKSSTNIAVEAIEIFSPEKSADLMENESNDQVLDDLKMNGDFYK